MQFENMSWWKKVMEQNKKFGGQGNFKLRILRNLKVFKNVVCTNLRLYRSLRVSRSLKLF